MHQDTDQSPGVMYREDLDYRPSHPLNADRNEQRVGSYQEGTVANNYTNAKEIKSYRNAMNSILTENRSLVRENDILRRFLQLKKENCDLKTLDIITNALAMCDEKLNDFILKTHLFTEQSDEAPTDNIQPHSDEIIETDRQYNPEQQQQSPSYGASFPEVHFSDIRTHDEDGFPPLESHPKSYEQSNEHSYQYLNGQYFSNGQGPSMSYGQSFPEMNYNELYGDSYAKSNGTERDQMSKPINPSFVQGHSGPAGSKRYLYKSPRPASVPVLKKYSPQKYSASQGTKPMKKPTSNTLQQPHMRFSMEPPRYPKKPHTVSVERKGQSGQQGGMRRQANKHSPSLMRNTKKAEAPEILYDSLDQSYYEEKHVARDMTSPGNAGGAQRVTYSTDNHWNSVSKGILTNRNATWPDRNVTKVNLMEPGRLRAFKPYKSRLVAPATGNVESSFIESSPIYVSSGQHRQTRHANPVFTPSTREVKPRYLNEKSSHPTSPFQTVERGMERNSDTIETHYLAPRKLMFKDTMYSESSHVPNERSHYSAQSRPLSHSVTSDIEAMRGLKPESALNQSPRLDHLYDTQSEYGHGNVNSYRQGSYRDGPLMTSFRENSRVQSGVLNEGSAIRKQTLISQNSARLSKSPVRDKSSVENPSSMRSFAGDPDNQSVWINITQRGARLNELYDNNRPGPSQVNNKTHYESIGIRHEPIGDSIADDLEQIGSPLHTSTPIQSERNRHIRFESDRPVEATSSVTESVGNASNGNDIKYINVTTPANVPAFTGPSPRATDHFDSPASLASSIRANLMGSRLEFDQSLAEAIKLAQPKAGRSEQVKSVLFRAVDTLTGYKPTVTQEVADTVLGSVPSRRLVGEIAFQLDRRIMETVIGPKKSFSGKKIIRSRYYGYSLANITQLIKKEAALLCRDNPVAVDRMEHVLMTRLNDLMTALKPLGYDFNIHAEFTQDMVNKYGLMKEAPDPSTVEGFGLGEPVVLRMLLGRLLGQGPVLDNMLILLDCLCYLSHSDHSPLFMW